MPPKRTCSECEAEIPSDARQGLCTRCLLTPGLKAGDNAASSPVERVIQWAHRNPALAAAVAALYLVLTVGIVSVFWKWQRAEKLAALERQPQGIEERNSTSNPSLDVPLRKPDLQIQPRTSEASSNTFSIDLSAHYNAALTQAWHYGAGSKGSTLSALPRGRQLMAGMFFEIRGIVQLAGRRNTGYPEQVAGIEVGRRIRVLHILHATGWTVKNGTEIASFVLHYTDGQKVVLPIVYGEDLREWHGRSDKSEIIQHGTLAWSLPNDRQKRRLFKTSQPNPLPDTEVSSIDYVSAMTDCFPFLIAMTAE